METLENRTREGAGVMARVCHSLGEAVRNAFRPGYVATAAEDNEKDAGIRALFETHGVPFAVSHSEQLRTCEVVVRSPEGIASKVFGPSGDELMRGEAKVEVALKVFVLFERCFRYQHNLHLVEARLRLVKVDGQWSLDGLPAAGALTFTSGGAELTRSALMCTLQKGSDIIKPKRAA